MYVAVNVGCGERMLSFYYGRSGSRKDFTGKAASFSVLSIPHSLSYPLFSTLFLHLPVTTFKSIRLCISTPFHTFYLFLSVFV